MNDQDGQTGPGLGQGHGLGHGHEQGHGLESLCVKFVVMKCCSLIGSFTPSFLKSVLILCQKGDIFAYEPSKCKKVQTTFIDYFWK